MAFERISIDPKVMAGVPCIRGTRIPVSVVLDCLAAGLGEADVVAEYPTLTIADIREARCFVEEDWAAVTRRAQPNSGGDT